MSQQKKKQKLLWFFYAICVVLFVIFGARAVQRRVDALKEPINPINTKAAMEHSSWREQACGQSLKSLVENKVDFVQAKTNCAEAPAEVRILLERAKLFCENKNQERCQFSIEELRRKLQG